MRGDGKTIRRKRVKTEREGQIVRREREWKTGEGRKTREKETAAATIVER